MGGKLASKLAHLKKLQNCFDFSSNGSQSVVSDPSSPGNLLERQILGLGAGPSKLLPQALQVILIQAVLTPLKKEQQQQITEILPKFREPAKELHLLSQ